MNLRRFHPLLFVLIGMGLIAATVSLATRYRMEARHRRVALVLDDAQLRSLAAATGVPLADAYRQFQEAGATGVAVTEETLADLQAEGALEVTMHPTPTGREYRAATRDPLLALRLEEYVSRRMQSATERLPAGDRVTLNGLAGPVYLPGRWDDIRLTPTGLDDKTLAAIRAAGMEPIARLSNPLGLTAESLRWTLSRVKQANIDTIIFGGEEVLGFRKLIPQTADAFREFGLLYGSVEFGKQRGDEALSRRLEDRLVRVHSIAAGEMPRLTPQEAIERYVRGAAERNIRLAYVRLPGNVTEQTYRDNLDYVRTLNRQLSAAGFSAQHSGPFPRVWPRENERRAVAAAVGMGIGVAAVLLLATLVPVERHTQFVLSAPVGVAFGWLILSGWEKGPELAALAAAVIFPTLAFTLFPQPVGAFEEHKHAGVRGRSDAIIPALGEFAMISLVTLIGAAMVAAPLSELPYLLKTRSFIGIKVATVLPILIVGWVYLTGMTGEYPSWAAERQAVTERLRAFFGEPLRVWHTVAMLIGLVALALLVARSGNDGGVGVSELELKFRALLDRVLGVRPRTKEFLIGHPALVLALGMATLPLWRRWALPVLLVGIIGQVGMLNSFCHLHSPLRLTALRTFHGLWIGALLGLAVLMAWLWVTGRLARKPERLTP